MIVTYAIEPLATARPELEQLLPFHWAEIARDKDNPKFALKPDWDTYHFLEMAGQFAMMVVRVDGRMVGYVIGFVRRQMHYADSLSFICDIYFVLPEYRKGRIGLELFKELEKAMVARGVDKIYLGCKAASHLDRSRLFEHLGYQKIEYVFAKVIAND